MTAAGWLDRMRSDHQQVLDRLTRLAPATGDGEASPWRPDLPAVREFVVFLTAQFDRHMGAEDAVLFPILADALPATTESLEPLHLEHDELRSMLAALATLLDAQESGGRNEQIGIQMMDLAELLRIHIRKEERLVFQVAERVLPSGELERLVSERVARMPAPRSTPSPNEGNSR